MGNPSYNRRGVTLIELLVVIGIMLLLVVASGPVMRGPIESRRMRDAARALNVALSIAQKSAIANGLPAGVIFRAAADPKHGCNVIVQAESPPPYGGETETATITCTPKGMPDPVTGIVVVDVGGADAKPGDWLRVNYQGPLWRILAISGAAWTLQAMPPAMPPATPPGGLPFTIIRQPVPATSDPLDLPMGVVVDMEFSGTDGPALPSMASGGEVMIVFASNGGLDSVVVRDASGNSGMPTRLTEPLYLLVGRRTRLTNLKGGGGPADGLKNYQDPSNFWIGINPSGLIVTQDVAADGAGASLADSRALVRKFSNRGGR